MSERSAIKEILEAIEGYIAELSEEAAELRRTNRYNEEMDLRQGRIEGLRLAARMTVERTNAAAPDDPP